MSTSSLKSKRASPVVLLHSSDEGQRERLLVGVPGMTAASEEPILEVSLYPRTGPLASSKPTACSKVDGVHVGVSVVAMVGLAVAVVETTAGVDVSARGDHVDTTRFSTSRNTYHNINTSCDSNKKRGGGGVRKSCEVSEFR